MLKIAPAVWVVCSKASLQERSSMSSASAPIWECAVAPNSGSVTGLGFCRLLVRHPQAELARSVPKMAREDERIGAVTRWLFALVKKRLPPMPVGLGWTRAGTNKYKSTPGRLEVHPAPGEEWVAVPSSVWSVSRG